ncbi:uncharacterized protein LOC121047143 [Ixodes scapularis]|uniref:uncharacterized protein LOC121047143 n=1 Tax=Ixodes scapularis TaxID=6945 RepID=UPI001C385095|nr:uncharacterized protein LOC121047143 [Ixodes scapularis]
MYSVVDFVDSPNGSLKSIDVVPSTWVKNGKCSWPPYSNARLLQAAAVTCAAPDPADWTLHNVSILCTATDYARAVHKCQKLTRTAQLTSESEVDDIVSLRPMVATIDESLERGCLPPFPDAGRDVSTVADHGQRPGSSHFRNPSQEIKARIQALQESERRAPAHNSSFPPAETPAFPLPNKDDVAALESRIVEGGYRQTLVEWLSKIGGDTTREAAVRVLRATLTDELASQYSWFGAKGKVQFGTLQLASVLYDAVIATGAITKDFQVTTMGWMKHARQRVEQKQKKAGTAMEGSRAPSPLEGDR